jgi:hypothetical protein
MERWRKDESPGRVLKWLSTSRQSLDPADSTSAADSAKQFIDDLHKQDTRLARTLKAYNDNIDHCLRSLIFLFNKRCISDLTTLSERLNTAQWPGGVLQDFTRGLCAELSDDPAAAVSHYQTVIDTCSRRLADSDEGVAPLQRIIEESLVRMTQSFLALHDRASACSTLGTLCEMLPQYMVPYARLLNLCGNADSAIELLQCYLQHIPQNREASILLAEIHSAQGNEAKAEEVLTMSESHQDGKQAGNSEEPAHRNAA